MPDEVFQHTAARRRLGVSVLYGACRESVSTHSRPKAAGFCDDLPDGLYHVSFNTQPPEGGWEQSEI